MLSSSIFHLIYSNFQCDLTILPLHLLLSWTFLFFYSPLLYLVFSFIFYFYPQRKRLFWRPNTIRIWRSTDKMFKPLISRILYFFFYETESKTYISESCNERNINNFEVCETSQIFLDPFKSPKNYKFLENALSYVPSLVITFNPHLLFRTFKYLLKRIK